MNNTPATSRLSSLAGKNPVTNTPKRGRSPQVTVYAPKEFTDRIKNTLAGTYQQDPEGLKSLSQFFIDAAAKEIARLEKKYNDGKPFPPASLPKKPGWL